MLSRKAVFAAKVEATPGTAESLAAGDGAFNAQQLMLEPTTEIVKREAQGSFARKSGVPGGHRGSYTFRTDLAWDGTATLPTWVTVLLAGCGYVNTAGTVTPRTEEPGANVKTLTLGRFIDGVYERLAGAVGSARILLETGRPSFIEWNFEGIWVAATDLAIIAPTYPTVKPIRYASATTTYDSLALCLSRLTIDLGNKIYLNECAAGPSGFKHGLISDREPTITIDPESRTIASQNRYGMLYAGTEAAFVVSLTGFSGNATLAITAPKAQPMSVKRGDREGISTDSVVLACNENTTVDTELSMVFTEAS